MKYQVKYRWHPEWFPWITDNSFVVEKEFASLEEAAKYMETVKYDYSRVRVLEPLDG
jgi:hypothetical protein